MKGPVPSQKQINHNRRDQVLIRLSRALGWEDLHRGMTQTNYSPRAVLGWVPGNQSAIRAMLRCLCSEMGSVLQRARIGQSGQQEPKMWIEGEGKVALQSIRELIKRHRSQRLQDKHLQGVWERNGFQGEQTLCAEVSFLYSKNYPLVEPGMTDAFRVWRVFSLDWGRILEEGNGQGVWRKRLSAQVRSPVQSLGSSGRTPVHQWNCHG